MRNRYTDWWKEPENIDQILTMAWEMDEKYPDCRIVAPGESFAWTVYTIGLKRRAEGRDPNVSFVPFSGEIYNSQITGIEKTSVRDGTRLHEYDSEIYGHFLEMASPSRVLRAAVDFTAMLEHTQNSPKDIVAQHQAHERKTVFIDKVCTGEGIISFCVLMDTLAKQQGVQDAFRKAVHYQTYSMEPSFNPSAITIEHIGAIPANMSVLAFCPNRAEFDRMNVITISNDDSKRSARFQPLFNVARGRGDCKVIPNDGVKLRIREILGAAVSECVVGGDGFIMHRKRPPEPTATRKSLEYTAPAMAMET